MNSTVVYLKIYFKIIISGLLIVAGINIFVDPYNIYRLVKAPGFNQKKSSIFDSAMRRSKSIDITEENYNALILGSSRVARGINPKSSILSDLSVYNAGLNSAKIYEIYHILKYSQKHLDLKAVILGLDFEVFLLDANQGWRDFELSRFAGKNIYIANWKKLLSWETVKFSWETVNTQKQKHSFVYTDRGFKKSNYFLGNYDENFKRASQSMFASMSNKKKNISLNQNNIKYNLELLEEIIKECQKNNIQLYLFITPVHSHQLETYRLVNLFSLYEEWKKQLVIITNKLLKNNKKSNYILWDFSGYNIVTTEKIQEKNMNWYWDPSHYKKEVGEIILSQLFNRDEKQQFSEDFGKIINIHNIESHLRDIRQERMKYQQRFPVEVEKVEQIAKEMKTRLEP